MDNFDSMSASFPDPLGVGHSISLGLAIFGELACSIGFIFGALYRLAMIPMIFTMGMAFFVIHGNDPFSLKELAFILFGGFYPDVYNGTRKILVRSSDSCSSVSKAEVSVNVRLRINKKSVNH